MTSVYFYLSVIILISSVSDVKSKGQTIEERIKHDPDLSEFYAHVESNVLANTSLQYKAMMVFAPTNKAFQSYRSNVSIDSLVSYHMVSQPYTIEELRHGTSLPTEYPGNKVLWVTKTKKGEVFINNAKIDNKPYKSNVVANNKNNKKQVLHIINEVLEPVVSTNPDRPLYKVDAFTFLNQSEEISLGNLRLRTFRQRVHQLNKQSIFQTTRHCTFFIPIDDGFTPPPRSEKIDAKVIDGHVVCENVLFTAATPQGVEYSTIAMGDMIKVSVSFTQQMSENRQLRMYVKSTTIQGDSTHHNGVVLAEIVRANIPVENGVVHLIHRPLMVVDSTVTEFLKDDVNGPTYKFYRHILDSGGDFLNRITRLREVTLFAPNNEAWNEQYLNSVVKDQVKLKEILDLHLVETKLTVDNIISNNQKELYIAPTAAGTQFLYFNVAYGPNNLRNLTVEGSGVNATVVQPDIAATNGVIHIINRVLGVPYLNMKEKLLSDPMLNKTATLGEKTHFNNQLASSDQKFTYFVPRDYAWKQAEVNYPSAYKKLFMPGYQYHVEQILQRHLVVSDHAFTIEELYKLSNLSEYTTLQTVRDPLKIKVKENNRMLSGNNYNNDVNRKGYQIEWRGSNVNVFRPNVYCTNGIIHVIDRVLIQESDVKVNGEPALKSATFIINICLVLIAKFYF